MAVSVSVTVTQVDEDGSESPADGELAVALAGTVEQFSSMLAWAAEDAASRDHGEREKVIAETGRELQRRLLEATLTIDSAREERISHVTSAAGIGTAASRRAMTGAWPASSARSVPGGWPTATGASRTCTRPTPAGCCPMTLLAGDARPGGLPSGRRRVRAGAGDHRGPDRGHDRPGPAGRPGRGPGRLDRRLLRAAGPGRGGRPAR